MHVPFSFSQPEEPAIKEPLLSFSRPLSCYLRSAGLRRTQRPLLGPLPRLSRQAPGGRPSSFCRPYLAILEERLPAGRLGPKHHATESSIRPWGPLWTCFALRQHESLPEWNLRELGP